MLQIAFTNRALNPNLHLNSLEQECQYMDISDIRHFVIEIGILDKVGKVATLYGYKTICMDRVVHVSVAYVHK